MNSRMKVILKHYDRVTPSTIPGASSRTYYVAKRSDSAARLKAELQTIQRREFLPALFPTFLAILGI